MPMEPHEFALNVLNTAASMINQTVRDEDGESRSLPPELLAGVLVAQSNLAIAAALMLRAEES